MNAVQDLPSTVAEPPPQIRLVRAMIWNWWIVLICVLVCAGVGATLALVRTEQYTATSRLVVGRIDITSPGALSGFAVATQSLATGYSRTVTSQAVAKEVSERTGIPVKDVQKHVVSTPVPESPVFKIEATAPDRREAIRLANLSGQALIRYQTALNRDDPDSERLYAKYRKAVATQKHAEQNLETAESEAEERSIPPVEEQLERRRAELAAASLRADALAKAYTASVQSQIATDLIQVISPANDAVSDRRSTLVIYTFIGLVAGLLIGAALAYMREWRLTVGSSR